MRGSLLFSALLAFLLFIYEVIILYFISSVFYYLVFHLVTLIILSTYLLWAYREKVDLLYPILLLTLGFGAGPFGLASFLMTALLYPLFKLIATPASVWFEGLFPERRLVLFEKILHRIKAGWDDYSGLGDASSFRFLLKYGSLSEKQMVLDAIVENFDPTYTPILKEALNDPQNSVRIQAGAIYTKLDMDFNEELERLKELYDAAPDNMDVVLQLAKHADAYAAGLLEGYRQKEMAAFAIKMYRIYFGFNREDQNVWLAIGRLLYGIKDYPGYIEWFKETKKMGRAVPSLLEMWYKESLYMLRLTDETLVNR